MPPWNRRTALYLFAIGFSLGIAVEAYRDSIAWGKLADRMKDLGQEIELQSIIEMGE